MRKITRTDMSEQKHSFSNVAAKNLRTGLSKKYYAVAVGREVGIFFKPWCYVKNIVSSYPGAKYKGFKTLKKATIWISQKVKSSEIDRKKENEVLLVSSSRTTVKTMQSPLSSFKYKSLSSRVEIEEVANDSIVIYTDGSAVNSYSGWGVVVTKNNKIINEIYGMTPQHPGTNNQGELYAIYVALCNYPNASIIYTDSQYSMNSVTKWVHKWMKNGWRTSSGKPVKNTNYIKMIYDLLCSRGNITDIRWIKAHTGHTFNERADNLAEYGRYNYSFIIDKPTDMMITETDLSSYEVISSSCDITLYHNKQTHELYWLFCQHVSESEEDYIKRVHMQINSAVKLGDHGVTPAHSSLVHEPIGSFNVAANQLPAGLSYIRTSLTRKSICLVTTVDYSSEHPSTPITLTSYYIANKSDAEIVSQICKKVQFQVNIAYLLGYAGKDLTYDDFVIVSGKIYLFNVTKVYSWVHVY